MPVALVALATPADQTFSTPPRLTVVLMVVPPSS
jgi:hypothetical protein